MKQTIIYFLFFIIAALLYACQPFSSKEDQQAAISQDSTDSIGVAVEAIVGQIREPNIPDRNINIIEFSGHLPDKDGTFDFRQSIQDAIDSLAQMGGGRLILAHSQGQELWIKQTETYRLSGPIHMRSNTALVFDPSVRLFFEFNPPNYLHDGQPVLTRYEGTTLYGYSPCIRVFNAENVLITFRGGSGAMPVIDGDGEAWQAWSYTNDQVLVAKGITPPYRRVREMNRADIPIAERKPEDPSQWFLRPNLIQLFLSKRVLIEDVKLVNSPFWVVHPVFSEEMIFRGLSFDAPVVNNDGIDPESSRNILIEHIMFDNHDDNVAIKAGRDKEGRDGALVVGTELETIDSRYIKNGRIGGPTENVVVRECVFKGHNAFCVGSEMSGGVRNIYVLDNISVQDVVSGVYIKSSRKRGGTVEDIYVRNMQLNKVRDDAICLIPNYDNDRESEHPPLFKNIYIEGLTARQARNGIRIFGWFDHPIEDVLIKNTSISQVNTDSLLISQAKNIKLQNVTIGQHTYNENYTLMNRNDTTPHTH